jgi:FMN phosphatase YigB (HAD superfamily)
MIKLILFDLDNTLYDCDGQLNGSYEQISSISAFEGVSEVLTVPGAINILVTKGNPLIQRKKIKILGIEGYFDEAYFLPRTEDKQKIFRQIADKYRTVAHEIFAIGDRIDSEIRYGNECGFKTVLMAHGKYYHSINPKNRMEKPIHIVSNCRELAHILRI